MGGTVLWALAYHHWGSGSNLGPGTYVIWVCLMCCSLSCHEGFLRVLRFPPSSKINIRIDCSIVVVIECTLTSVGWLLNRHTAVVLIKVKLPQGDIDLFLCIVLASSGKILECSLLSLELCCGVFGVSFLVLRVRRLCQQPSFLTNLLFVVVLLLCAVGLRLQKLRSED